MTSNEKIHLLFNPIIDRYAPWESVNKPIKRRIWTEKDLQIIRDNIHKPYKEVTQILAEAGSIRKANVVSCYMSKIKKEL